MKVLFLTTIYPPDIGGPATYVFNLVSDFQKNGWQTRVITQGRVRFLSMLVNALIIGRSFDIFYANGGIGAGIPALIAGKFLKKKVAIKITGDYAWEQARNRSWTEDDIDDFQNEKYSPKINFLKWLRAIVAKKADLAIVPSNYLKEMVVGWGVPEEKIKVIYNASAANVIKKHNKEGDEKIIFSAGRFVPWKGFDILVSVFAELVNDFPNAKLVLAGSGALRESLEKFVLDNNIQGKVIFTGDLNKAGMNQWYAKADCFVLYSGYEGLSHVLLEALGAGLPIIASRKGGNTELIKDGENGLLVDWGDREGLKNALRVFLERGIKAIKKPGLLDPDKFLWERLVRNTTSAFESLVKPVCITFHTERLHDDLLWERIKKLVDFFEKNNVCATWFSFNPTFHVYKEQGFSEEKWKERLRYIANHGQVIEQHTHFYKRYKGDYDLSNDHIYQRIKEDKEWLENQGYKISGFVSGGWRLNQGIINTLSDLGFKYDCSARSSIKKHLNDRDHLILPKPIRNGNLWLIPTTSSVKEALFFGKKDVVYLHDYDLQNRSVEWALKLFVLLNKKKRFVCVNKLIPSYE